MAYIMSSSNFSGLWSTSLNFSEKEVMTFRGHFTTCKQLVMENWMQQNSFIHSPCVIRHIQTSKNLSLLQGLQWQTRQHGGRTLGQHFSLLRAWSSISQDISSSVSRRLYQVGLQILSGPRCQDSCLCSRKMLGLGGSCLRGSRA